MASGEWRVYEWGRLRLKAYIHPCVYEPSDDTRLAVEALAAASRIWQSADLVVDLGSGTGLLGLAASKLFGAHVIAVDINPWAVEASRLTLGWRGSVVRCSWDSCIGGRFDLAVSNPPYLPVEDRLGECGGWLEASWSGGPRHVAEACEAATRLAPRVILVYSSLSGFDVERCLGEKGYSIILRFKDHFFMETLYAVVAEERSVEESKASLSRDGGQREPRPNSPALREL